MTSTAPYPDRGLRPGGRWSSADLVDEIFRLATTERALAHVAAGWVPKVPAIDDKLELAATLESSLTRASELRRHGTALCERDEGAVRSDPAWVGRLLALDSSGTPARVLGALTGELPAVLRARYEELRDRLDPLFDHRLLTTVRRALQDLGPGRRSEAHMLEAWRGDDAATVIALDDVLWAPVDRVRVPARPAGRPRLEPGARAHFRRVSRLENDDIAGELNDNVMAEICAMELMARSSYEHPELPWSFHLACARHAADEARHAAMFRRLLAERGFDESLLLQHVSNYEYAYEFPECEPGSRRELAWRLLILCTVLEALAIDKLPLEIAVRDTIGQHDIARALDYASTDELYHVENGLVWTRKLCAELGLDPIIERERAHGRFFGRQRDLRIRYLEADPERAAREIAIFEGPDLDGMTFTSRTERELRKRASFSEAECQQVDRWGYNPRSTPEPAPAT